MTIDVKSLGIEQLRSLIQNYRTKRRTDDALYVEAFAELERRTGKGLDFDKTLAAVLSSAKRGKYLSYKELTDASGVGWSNTRYAVNGHLGNLVEYCHRKGWPLLSAIVVNKENLETGQMEPSSLRGFITAARQLGYPVTDEQAFLKEQQRQVFEWAKSG
jgi:hypothetical protein